MDGYASTVDQLYRLKNNNNDNGLPSSSKGSLVDSGAVAQLIEDILNPMAREHALAELSRCRESVPDLAVQLWEAFGVVAVLLQEVIGIYHLLSPPALTSQASTRVCNALALMQCLASHDSTRAAFLQGISHVIIHLF